MTSEQPETTASTSNDLADVDLYCLHCGYNLRGLSGDPRRCPECGKLSPISELTLPAEMIAKQLRRMESWPTICVGLALLLMLIFVINLLILVASGFSETAILCSSTVAFVPGVYWLVGVQEFKSACMGKHGWSGVLLEYHLYGLGLCVLIILSLAVGFHLLGWHGWLGPWRAWAGVAIVITGCTSAALLAFRVHRRCKAKMDALQRDVALKLASEQLRRRLSRSRR